MWWDQNPSFPSSFQGPRPSSHLVVSHRLASLPALALGCQAAHPPDASGRAERHLRHLPWALIRPVSLAAGELRYPLDKVLQNLLVGDDTLAGPSVHPHPANYCCSIGRVRADGASEPRTVGDACVDVPNTRFYSPVPLLACPHRPPIPHFFQVAVLPASNCPLLTFVGGHTAAALRSRSSTKTSPGERPSQETHPRKKSTPETRGATSTVTSRLHSTERADQNHTTARRQTKPHQQTPPPHRTTRARTHARTPRKSHAPTLLPARLHRPASRGSLLVRFPRPIVTLIPPCHSGLVGNSITRLPLHAVSTNPSASLHPLLHRGRRPFCIEGKEAP